MRAPVTLTRLAWLALAMFTAGFILAVALAPMPANPGECRTDSECAAIMGGNGDPVPA